MSMHILREMRDNLSPPSLSLSSSPSNEEWILDSRESIIKEGIYEMRGLVGVETGQADRQTDVGVCAK